MKIHCTTNRFVLPLAALALFSMPAPSAHALGTASGTPIVNTVTATYDDGSGTVTQTASATVLVDNKINLTVVKNADAAAAPGATDQALVFVVKNDGNTPQRYALAATNGAGLVMNNVRIYLDNGTTAGSLDAGDTLYVNAGTFGDVPADGTLGILIVADVPAGALDGQTSDYNLVATTVDAGTTTVTTETTGAGTAGVDVVFADIAGSAVGDLLRNGQHSASGRYAISALSLSIVKSATIASDPFNGTISPKAIPGATISYTIAVAVTGSGTAATVVITDPMPANATYTPGTLKLNGAPLTDGTGDDNGSVGGSPTTATVTLGNMTSATPVQTITFDVTIN